MTDNLEKAFMEALTKLGEPDDVFNKWHMDEGELRSFFYEAIEALPQLPEEYK